MSEQDIRTIQRIDEKGCAAVAIIFIPSMYSIVSNIKVYSVDGFTAQEIILFSILLYFPGIFIYEYLY